MFCNEDPRQLCYLAGILYNGYLPAGNKKQQNKEGDVRSVSLFVMTRNNTALNTASPDTTQPHSPKPLRGFGDANR